ETPDQELGFAPSEDVEVMIREATESPQGQATDAEVPEEPEIVAAADGCNASAEAPEGEGEAPLDHAEAPAGESQAEAPEGAGEAEAPDGEIAQPDLDPVSDAPPREPYLRLPMEELAPRRVELRIRQVLQGEVFGPSLEVGQRWLRGPPREGLAGFWRGFVTATIHGPPRGPFFEFVNLWGTRTPPGTMTPCWIAEPWAPPEAGLGGGPLTGLPPAGEGGQPPEEGGGEWGAHLEDEGGVIDVPPEMEFAFLDGRPMARPEDSAPHARWAFHE
ncbi:unnamed protein product, partial [Prorocentrum cordatum]